MGYYVMNFLQASILFIYFLLTIFILLSREIKINFGSKEGKNKFIEFVTTVRSTFRYHLPQMITLLLP